jgi:hypothetical protein
LPPGNHSRFQSTTRMRFARSVFPVFRRASHPAQRYESR